MDFFEAQARAKKRTSRLVALFALAVPTLLAATSQSLHALVFWRFAQGLFVPGVIAVMMAYINEEFTSRAGRMIFSECLNLRREESLKISGALSVRDKKLFHSQTSNCDPADTFKTLEHKLK